MEMTWLWMVVSGLLGAAFFVLLAAGLVSRARRGIGMQRRGFAMASARAAERFARGEIDESEFRRLREDLRTAR